MRRIIPSIKFFLQDSRSAGILLLCCTVVSLLVSNSGEGRSYVSFWEQELPFHSGPFTVPETLLHLVNDLLMSLFFFSAGLEIKKEIVVGQLNSARKALMPVISATGGMVVPALIYLAWCHDADNFTGWGVPMATDIAFSLGVLSLLGNKAPLSLRIFLTAIAIIDDIGGILTIALFYAGKMNVWFLLASLALVALLATAGHLRRLPLAIYVAGGAILWYFVFNSGIHATIAGVALAFLIPMRYIPKLEHGLRVPVNFIVLPLFALANTAIILPADHSAALNHRVHYAVFTGLVLGKPIGIFASTWLAQKLKIARVPGNLSMKQVLGTGMVAGIGFTVSMFISMLAFKNEEYQLIAKLGVMNASLVSGIAGYLYLRFSGKKKARHAAGYKEQNAG